MTVYANFLDAIFYYVNLLMANYLTVQIYENLALLKFKIQILLMQLKISC
jgi:hypothetical protein